MKDSWLGGEPAIAKFAAEQAAQHERMFRLAESPIAKLSAELAAQHDRMLKLAESPIRIAEMSQADAQRLATAVGPRLTELTGSLGTVATRLSADVARRAADISADVIELVALEGVEESVDQLASEVAAAPGYEELWDEVQAEVEAILDQSPQTSKPVPAAEAASWHVSWLLFTLRASLPSVAAVETIGKIASVSVVAFVSCGVIRTGYPALWAELQELQLTPFDLLGYLFAAMAWAEVQRGKSE